MSTSVKQLHQQADFLLDQGNLIEARKVYETICELDENDSDAWLMKGAIDGETGKVDDAISHVKKAIYIEPTFADAYHTLAQLLLSRGRATEARDSLLKAVELDPEYTEAWVALAGVQGQLQDESGAEHSSRQALSQDSSLADARMILGNALSSQGKNLEAVEAYQEVTRLKPHHQASWSRLGIVQMQLNDIDAAEISLEKALKLDANDLPVQIYSALMTAARGDIERGIQQLHKIIRTNPENELAWTSMKNLAVQFDQSDSWVKFAQDMTKNHPDCEQAWLGLGYACEHNNLLEQALDSYQKAADLAPVLHEALSRKGIVFARLEKFDEAQACFEEALAKGSEAAVSYFGYGSMLRRKGWFDQAEEKLRLAIEKQPDRVEAYIELSRLFLDMGRFEETVDVLRTAMALEPESQMVAAGLAEVYERMGMAEEAFELLRPFLDRDDIESQAVCIYAKLSRTLDKTDHALAKIRQILDSDRELTIHQRLDLNFRAAEIYRSKNDYENAISHYHAGNACKPVDYDRGKHRRFVSDAMAAFNRETLTVLPKAKVLSDRPVFIVGMPRSGTTLVEQILSCHDQVFGAGELMHIGNMASTFGFRRDMPVPSLGHFKSLDQGFYDEAANDYLSHIALLSSDEIRVIDKMPGNFFHLGLIQQLFPGARIIHTQRDARDTCLSCYFTDFNGVHEYAYNLESLGHYYNEYLRLMQHWRNNLSIPMLDICYEELIADVEGVSRRLVDFCGLDWDAKVLDFYKSERLVNTASYKQVNKPVYTSSVGRWRHYEDYIEPLLNELKQG